GPVPPSLPRPSWTVRCGGSPPSAHRAPDCLRRATPAGIGGYARTPGRRGPSSSGTRQATAGRRACRSWVYLSVVDQTHFGVGLCWWLLSGLFARHAEFAWQDKYGSAPVSRSRACGQASGAWLSGPYPFVPMNRRLSSEGLMGEKNTQRP